ncbi:uncharacterized protein LOC114533484 [Dendronephthya gigantea]|uniref:uncharacterized protein LOC114533484 n=1 Tax=Dendronephthya gigantea TaxID=151771 RepID=UPI00106A8482|nr:uncharacterized protein LOC114533484 [Dendronephthya gigantea]
MPQMPFCFYTHVGMAYDILFVWYCLYVAIVCASGNTTATIEIKRGRYDKFTPQNVHLESQGSNQTAENLCKSFKAECENDECKYCQCREEDRSTFLLETPTTGNCTKDQDIIRDSVPNGIFFLRNQNYGKCLTINGNRIEKLFGTDCSSSLNMRWIWLNETGKIQLMNVMSLQCLEFVKSLSTCSHNRTLVKHSVVMKQCDRTNRKQQIKTSTRYIFAKMCGGQANFYLEIDEHSKGAISKTPSSGQTWENKNGDLDRKTITYRGCYRFSNKKLMLYLDKDDCSKPCTRNFSAPIFSENSQCSIIWSKSTIMRSDMMWQKVTKMTNKKPISIKTISKDLKMLLIKEEAFDIFNNSLLKLEISCENKTNESSKENHCLLLKFRSPPKKVGSTMTAIPSTTILTAKMIDTTEIASTTTAKMTDTTEIASTTTAKMTDTTEIASTTTAKMADATEIASTKQQRKWQTPQR